MYSKAGGNLIGKGRSPKNWMCTQTPGWQQHHSMQKIGTCVIISAEVNITMSHSLLKYIGGL